MIIASLIVLLPGMALTNAVNELTSQHLVSGVARFAGALATVLKLTVGSMIEDDGREVGEGGDRAVAIGRLPLQFPLIWAGIRIWRKD